MVRAQECVFVYLEVAVKITTPTQAFDVLREEQPQVFEKVYPVVGDVSHVRLGLSEDDQAFLVENTDLVFHLAATIRFDAPLRQV